MTMRPPDSDPTMQPQAAPAPPTEDEPVLAPSGRLQVLKRICDVAVALLLLALAIPVVVCCALLIRLCSRGPVFYTQTRLGQFGKPFTIWKLRTMVHNCELTTGARWALRNDPRSTGIGRFLRLTHLDELPQLWNVLAGHMSLVGPRPERPEFIPALEQAIGNYRQRLLVRPGVTGLAQLYLPADTGIASVRKKVTYDLHYIQQMGCWFDFRLMLATALQSVGLPCRFVRRLLRLPRIEQIEGPRNVDKPAISSQSPPTDPHCDRSYETRT